MSGINAVIHVCSFQLTDLCSLDPGVLRFPYSVVAASAFCHILQPEDLTLLVSGKSLMLGYYIRMRV